MIKRNRFDICLPIVLEHEGGFVDHPNDPGGATNKGITLGTFRRYLGRAKTVEQLKEITDVEVEEIYKRGFWDTANCYGLPRGVDLCLFDMAVNAGPSLAQKLLQRALNVEVDGFAGPITRSAAHRRDLVQTIVDFQGVRSRYYQSRPHARDFIKGWTNRVDAIHQQAIEMASEPYEI
jgi:lysozyme family protein